MVTNSALKAPRFAAGSCTPFDDTHLLQDQELQPGQKFCMRKVTRNGGIVTAQLDAMNMDAFARTFFPRFEFGRPVIDKTGLKGLFDFHLEYATDQTVPDSSGGPSIFAALQQQLGLKLTPTRAFATEQERSCGKLRR
jgi:uncharacterized protein (TIGR03435 family)